MTTDYTPKFRFSPAAKRQTRKRSDCPDCDGSGFASSEDDKTKAECKHCVRVWFDEKLTAAGYAELAETDAIVEPEFVSALTANLWITAPWSELLPRIKGAALTSWLRSSDPDKRLAFVLGSDQDVLDAKFVKVDKYNKDKPGEPPPELVSPPLLVLRLGFLGYKNDAAAGYTLALLMARQKHGRPTWVTDTPDCPLVGGAKKHLTWSEELEHYLSAQHPRVST